MLLNLWRRAPLWRLCLIAGTIFTALAIMFPPPTRHAASVPPASFAPPPDRMPTTLGAIASPASTEQRLGVIPYAGHQFLLPAGQWRVLSLGRDEGAQPKQIEVLARAKDTQLTGLLVLVAPDPLSHPAGLLQTPEACTAPGLLASELAPPPPGGNPYLHECWTLSYQSKAALQTDREGGLLQRAGARLAAAGLTVPDRLLALRSIRSTEFGWFVAVLYMPAGPSPGARPERAMLAWTRRYAALLHRGYDGALPPGTLAPPAPKSYE